jgi:subtilisin-like proprotein convertase family protein
LYAKLSSMYQKLNFWQNENESAAGNAGVFFNLATADAPQAATLWPQPYANVNIPDEIGVPNLGGSYTGAGVRVGIVDNGFQINHPDLAGVFNTSLSYDFVRNDNDVNPEFTTDNHGTAVAGVIAAQPGGPSPLGVAIGAELVGYKVDFEGAGDANQFVNALNAGVNVDVLNNSWGFTTMFGDNFKNSAFTAYENALINNVANGRGGLGTNVVFAAGNNGDLGDNVNYHNMINSPFTIAVGATNQNGTEAYFTTPGAAVLVSAPGHEVLTTDRTGTDGYVSGDSVSISGTSFAAPTVSGVIALMLEANPNLGYRDVQEILAYSATKTDPSDSGWQVNDANNFNGGGLNFNHLFGFGEVDASAAVRLAESWHKQEHFGNLLGLTTGTINVGAAIPDGSSTGLTYNIEITDDFLIEHVLLDLNISHTWQGDIRVTLISPEGTESVLIDRPGVSASSQFGSSADNINFETVSLAHMGESTQGIWQIKVTDNDALFTGTWNNFNLSFYGNNNTVNDGYVYTDAFSTTPTSQRTLSDTDGGTDTLQLAALSTNSTVNLTDGTATIDSTSLTINDAGNFENIIGGWGDDTFTGNDADNLLAGGRGADKLDGKGGTDTAYFNFNFIDAVFNVVTDTVGDWLSITWNAVNDLAINIENFVFNDVTKVFSGFADLFAPNVAPVAADERVTAQQSQALTFDPRTNDADENGDTLTISNLGTPENGSVVLNIDGTVTYTPASGFYGVDSFTYEVSDGRGGTSTATSTIVVEQTFAAQSPIMSTAYISNYALDQAQNIPINISGNTLTISGNNWKKLGFDYTVTDWTMMEVDVRVNSLGEIQGIGIDRDNSWSNGNTKIFQFAGSQSHHKFVEDFRLDTDNGEGMGAWVKVVIPIGLYFNGDINYVTFVNDHDLAPKDASASYRNIVFYEDVPVPTDGADKILGHEGESMLRGGAGNDRLSGGAGNDILVLDIQDLNIDGGSGFDELRAEGGSIGQVIDLSNTRIEQIEFIDVGRNTAQDEIILTEADVLRVSDDDIIRIIGDAGDLVTATGFTTRGTDVVENGLTFANFIGSNGTNLYVEIDGIIMNGSEVV